MTEPVYRKSSYSNNGDCVELADLGHSIGVRDSKDPAGPVLHLDRSQVSALVASIRAGDLDHLA